MADFALYFTLGREHILDWKGYDHILFVIALCGVYLLSDWKKLLILVTAFTIGHSLTLALSAFNLIQIPSELIEFLIPLTILITALSNLGTSTKSAYHGRWIYIMALVFGLIHGMGFSNYLKSLLGTDVSIIAQLLAFNLGLEIGQILIVISILALAQLMVNQFSIKQRDWIIFLSAAVFSLSLQMSLERLASLLN
jgi:hypothetical protein